MLPLTREALLGHQRPTLRLTWELDPQTGKPVGRWIIEGPAPANARLASAA
jgi:hypothetical protein